MQFGADISSPAFSTPAFLMVPIIPVSHFSVAPMKEMGLKFEKHRAEIELRKEEEKI